MKVILAGINVEADLVKRAKSALGAEMTPEVISAAYARISRDPRNVDVLRKEARSEVGKARRSNEAIVFDMGHSSRAEHAVLNFDIIGISRIAVEALEHFRLASYTEKSQRYIRLGTDHIVPDEIEESGFRDGFLELVEDLSLCYEKLYRSIIESGYDSATAKEDARYLMPLATSAQLGMTINARTLEYMIGRLACHPLAEVRELSGKLSGIAQSKIPSLVKYPEPTEYYRTMPQIREEAGKVRPDGPGDDLKRVDLVDATPDGDVRLAAGIIFSGSKASYRDCYAAASKMKKQDLASVIASTMAELKSYDGVWREFENIDMLFEVLVSASCYAQLKRHRMTTQTVQPYSILLGVSVPESVAKAKEVGAFRKAVKRSEALYRQIYEKAGISADYALTNAHRRRVLVKINMRELYHFSRLRSDFHAQWEIREISDTMCALARERFPAGGLMLGGKDRFSEIKKRLTNNII